jgi:predicted SnoaL-like aldol condensation-catalyzing enzyme
MRQLFIAASAVLLCFCSCKNKTTVAGESKDTAMAQKNLDASHEVNKAFETGNVSALDSVIADDFVDHTDRGDKKGRDSLKAMVKMVHDNFKDMKMEVLKEFADNDYVFSWMRYSGNSDGAMGVPKGPYDMHSIEVVKFKDGKAVEHWGYADMQEMAKMMGQGTNMNQMDKNKMEMNKADSSKMKK